MIVKLRVGGVEQKQYSKLITYFTKQRAVFLENEYFMDLSLNPT